MSYTDDKDWEERLNGPDETPELTRFLIMNYLVNGELLLSLQNENKSGTLNSQCSLCNFSEGFKEAAEKFQEESGIEPEVDLSSLDNRILIREAVQSGNIEQSISLVNQLHPELLDNDRYLYFHLQQLHLIELIRYVRKDSHWMALKNSFLGMGKSKKL